MAKCTIIIIDDDKDKIEYSTKMPIQKFLKQVKASLPGDFQYSDIEFKEFGDWQTYNNFASALNPEEKKNIAAVFLDNQFPVAPGLKSEDGRGEYNLMKVGEHNLMDVRNHFPGVPILWNSSGSYMGNVSEEKRAPFADANLGKYADNEAAMQEYAKIYSGGESEKYEKSMANYRHAREILLAGLRNSLTPEQSTANNQIISSQNVDIPPL